MPVTAQDRHRVFRWFEEHAPEEVSSAVMEMFPPAGDDYVTRSYADTKFAAIDTKFDAVDRRFDEVDRRFEEIDRRFEEVDRRFDQVHQRFDRMEQRFVELEERMTMRIVTGIADLRSEMQREMRIQLAGMMATMLTIAGFVVGFG